MHYCICMHYWDVRTFFGVVFDILHVKGQGATHARYVHRLQYRVLLSNRPSLVIKPPPSHKVEVTYLKYLIFSLKRRQASLSFLAQCPTLAPLVPKSSLEETTLASTLLIAPRPIGGWWLVWRPSPRAGLEDIALKVADLGTPRWYGPLLSE